MKTTVLYVVLLSTMMALVHTTAAATDSIRGKDAINADLPHLRPRSLTETAQCTKTEEELEVVDYEIEVDVYHKRHDGTPDDCGRIEQRLWSHTINDSLNDGTEVLENRMDIVALNNQMCEVEDDGTTRGRNLATLYAANVYMYVFRGGGTCHFCAPDDSDYRTRLMAERTDETAKYHAADESILLEDGIHGFLRRLKKKDKDKKQKKKGTSEPTPEPTPEPTHEPTPEPTPEPTMEPTEAPIDSAATVQAASRSSETTRSSEADEPDDEPEIGTLAYFEAQIPGIEAELSDDLTAIFRRYYAPRRLSCLYSRNPEDISINVSIKLTTRLITEVCAAE